MTITSSLSVTPETRRQHADSTFATAENSILPRTTAGVPPPGIPSLSILKTLPISSFSYFDMLRLLLGNANPFSTAVVASGHSSSDHRGLQPSIQETVGSEINATNDSAQDLEPSVAGVNRTGYNEDVATAYFKYVNTGASLHARLYYTTTPDFVNFATQDQPFPHPTPTNPSPTANAYDSTADPVLGVNTSPTGIAPYRMYCGGIATSDDRSVNGIALSRSNDGGYNWTNKMIHENVAPVTATTRRYDDKPAIAVSLNTTAYDGNPSASLGQVYLAWADIDLNATFANSTHNILFSRSTDGGDTWSTPQIIATGYVTMPQIVVPANTGRVFVLWASYTAGATRTNQINMARSTNQGISFSTLPSVTNTRMFGPNTENLANGIHARSQFVARYNPVLGIQAVWHAEQPTTSVTEAPTNTLATDLYEAHYATSWSAITDLTFQTPGDQFTPAFVIDDTGQGNAYVTFYNSEEDGANNYTHYYEYYLKVTSGISVAAKARLSNVLSAAANIPNFGSLASPDRELGEYQDLWFGSYRRMVSAWIGAPTAQIDVYLSRIFLP